MTLPTKNEIGGFDLSVLQSYLYSPEQVQEEDETWDPDYELQKMASEMEMEREAQAGEQPVIKPVAKPKQRVRKPVAAE
jgi:hypothetical protein